MLFLQATSGARVSYFNVMPQMGGLCMQNSDLIALAFMLVAVLSALYSKHASNAARRANDIAVHQNLRPLRLAVYRSMNDFAHFCSTYRTLQHLKSVNGTRDLVERIESFKWEIGQHGPLKMPSIENKATEFQIKARQLQKILDRVAGGQSNPLDQSFNSAEENLDSLVDWFANERRELKSSFQTYLVEA